MTNLKRIIDEKGVRQRWLAEQVGMTEVSMSRYASGERIPKAPLAIRMADVLGVDVKELYGWDDKHVVGEPAQPETHEERTETHGVCLDAISRKAAIDALVGITMFKTKHELMQRVNASVQDEQGWLGAVAECLDEIEDLPSAQPELPEWAQKVDEYRKSAPSFVRNQLVWALYQTWKEYDGRLVHQRGKENR